ncbi:hypothetical protein [Anaerotignum sp.]|uniref:hypothetical protein n=1 Tax=Anaerotignum sp. TaxID=2039241 RepID=UPI00289D02F8|nr:hypothetical protein [Anaerotignum sp.]
MRKHSAIHKKIFIFFIFLSLVITSFGLRGTTAKVSESYREEKSEELSLLNAGIKIRMDNFVDPNQNMKFVIKNSFYSNRDLKQITIRKAVFDNVSYDDMQQSENKNFYSLFLKLIIIPSYSLFCLYIRRWIILVSNFSIGFIITRYLHLKDGKKQVLSFQ